MNRWRFPSAVLVRNPSH